MTFTKIPNKFIDKMSQYYPSHILVYMEIARRCQSRITDHRYESIADANSVLLHKDTVRIAIKALLEKGDIKISRYNGIARIFEIV